MGKIRILIFIVLSATMMSCYHQKDETLPIIKVKVEEKTTFQPNQPVLLTITLSSDSELKSFSIEGVTFKAAETSKIVSTIPEKITDNTNHFITGLYKATINYEFVLPATHKFGEKFKIKFTVTDSKAENTYEMTLPYGTLLTEEFTEGIIYNRATNRKTQIAWDLSQNISVNVDQVTTTVGDMINNTSSETPPYILEEDYFFIAGWNSLNSTYFTKIASNSKIYYENATLEQILSTYYSNNIYSSYDHVKKDDMFIAQIKAGTTYALIKITEVFPSSGEDGYIKFKYKKGVYSN